MEPGIAHTPGDAGAPRPGSPRRRLLKGAGLVGAAGVAGALLRSPAASAQSIEGGFYVVAPSGDATGADDTTAINNGLLSGYPVLMTPGQFYITGINMPASGAKLYGSGCMMPGTPAPSYGEDSATAYCTYIGAGSGATNNTPMISMQTASGVPVCECEIKNLHLQGNWPTGNFFSYLIYFADDTSGLVNDGSLIESVSCTDASTHNIYIGKNRGGITINRGWSYHAANGAALYIKGANTTVYDYITSDSDYGFVITGTVTALLNCQSFANGATAGQAGTNQISNDNVFLWGCDINQNYGSGIEVLAASGGTAPTGVSIHGRFEGNNKNDGTGTGNEAGTYHIDASGAGTTAGTSGSLLNGNAGGVNILPGTKFEANSFTNSSGSSWKVTYDIWTGGAPGKVNDWSTSDADYTDGHIDPEG